MRGRAAGALLALLLAALPAGAAAQASAPIGVSANPVTTSGVTFSWTAKPGTAHVAIYGLTGVRVTVTDLPNDPGQWHWDLTAQDGSRAANGQYYVVVTLGDNTRLQRRLLVAR